MKRFLPALSVAAVCAAAATCNSSLQPGGIDPTKPYDFPDCGVEDDTTCPGEKAFRCAMDAIAGKYRTCRRDLDCESALAPPPSDCAAFCSPASLARGNREAYQAELEPQITRYCNTARCLTSVNCPRIVHAVPGCLDGGCTWIEGLLPDAGQTDAGSRCLGLSCTAGSTCCSGAVCGDAGVCCAFNGASCVVPTDCCAPLTCVASRCIP